MRCVIVVYPYSLAQRDTDLLAECAYFSCARICIDDSRFSPVCDCETHTGAQCALVFGLALMILILAQGQVALKSMLDHQHGIHAH